MGRKLLIFRWRMCEWILVSKAPCWVNTPSAPPLWGDCPHPEGQLWSTAWVHGTVFESSTKSLSVLDVRNNFLSFTHNSATGQSTSEYRCHSCGKNCHLVLYKCLRVSLCDQFLNLHLDFLFHYLLQLTFGFCPPAMLTTTFLEYAFMLTANMFGFVVYI